MATKKKHSKKRDGDGLTARERAFVRERRADPMAPNAEVMRRAGYLGRPTMLTERARQMLRKPKIGMAVYAPVAIKDLKAISDEDLKSEIRRRFYLILTSDRTTDSDKIKAGDKLLATIPGGFVPVALEARIGRTMEDIVRAMGGAPDESPALPSAKTEDA